MSHFNHIPLERFSEREREILRLIATGLSNDEIARQLILTLGTVKWYNRQIYSKLGVSNRTQAVARARKLALLKTMTMTAAAVEIKKHNLPAQLTSFVGRQRELADLRHLLSQTRLLTLTGTGGSGKTRLALQLAEEMLGQFADGVYHVGLMSIQNPALVAKMIAATLDVPDPPHDSVNEVLKRALRNKHLLLLLDNFEHVIQAAPLVTELLTAAPRLKILVTSRAVLHLYGEQEYPVMPLALPDPAQEIEHLRQNEAVTLFVQRAQAAHPAFHLTVDNAAVVAEICARLDGLPLAIELAAARGKLLSPQMMLERLQDRFGELADGPRDLPDRQRTLRGVMDWSYALLNEDEKRLFARLSVFIGGCTLAAAEAICQRGLTLPVLDGLMSLMDKSLVLQDETVDGEPRFWMLETVREYAWMQLEAYDEAESLRRDHARYFVAYVERAEPELFRADQFTWLERLEEEHDNLRAALAWALDGADRALGLKLAGHLGWFWYLQGHEVDDRIEQALDSSPEVPPDIRARAMNLLAGSLIYIPGRQTQAKHWLDAAVQLSRQAGNPIRLAWSLGFMTSILPQFQHITPEELSALIEEALHLFRGHHDEFGINWALNAQGELIRSQRRYQEAIPIYRESLEGFIRMGNAWYCTQVRTNMGWAYFHLGEVNRAYDLFREALAPHARQYNIRHIAACLSGFAVCYRMRGQLEDAARLLSAIEARLKATGVWLHPADRADFERTLEVVRDRLEDSAFRHAWAEGQAMDIGQVLAFVQE